MHGNKIPPQLVTEVGDAFKRILEEVIFAFDRLNFLISILCHEKLTQACLLVDYRRRK